MFAMSSITGLFSKAGLYLKIVAAVAIYILGFHVGARMEAGKYADQMRDFAQTQVAIARAEIKATFEEGKRYVPFVQFQVERQTFFARERTKIADFYTKPSTATGATAGASNQPLTTVPSYVSTAPCGDGDLLFTPDELRLYNAGNRKAELGDLRP